MKLVGTRIFSRKESSLTSGTREGVGVGLHNFSIQLPSKRRAIGSLEPAWLHTPAQAEVLIFLACFRTGSINK